MKDILKFVGIFLLSYGLLIYLFNFQPVKSIVSKIFRSTVEYTVKMALPEAYIQTQDYLDEQHKIEPNVFYMVYGNPAVIKAEKEFATKHEMKEYTISTYSKQVYVFHMLTVPVAFLISIFIATPIPFKLKLKSIGISLFLLLIVIVAKCIFLTYYGIADSKIGIYTMSDSALNLSGRIAMMLTLGFSIIFGFSLWLLFGFRNSLFSSQFTSYIKSFQK